MKMELFMSKEWTGVRAVLLSARALDLDLELRKVDMTKDENKRPDFIKMNPMGRIPVLKDNDLILTDAGAISCYLANKSAKNDSLYPRDAKMRAKVDDLLFFDARILTPRLMGMARPIMKGETKTISEKKMDMAREAMDWMDRMIGDNKWVAGNQMTIADCCCAASMSTINMMMNGMEERPKLRAWMERCRREMPGWKECNQDGLDMMEAAMKKKMK